MSRAPKTKKLELTDEVLNKLVYIILGIDDIKKACGYIFNKNSLRKNNVVNAYLDAKMGDELRKYIYVKNCSKIRKDFEESLTIEDLLTIFRSTLKLKNYMIIGTRDKKDSWRYFIDVVVEKPGAI